MIKEHVIILTLLNDRKNNRQSISTADLSAAIGIYQYRKVKKILEGLKRDGYISRLIISDPTAPIDYELTDRGCTFKQELEEEKRLWWESNKVALWSAVLSSLLVICAITDTIVGICAYSRNTSDNEPTEQHYHCYQCECCRPCNAEEKPI